MEGCYYASILGTTFGLTQLIPILFIPFCLFITMITHESIFVLFSFFLYIPQFIVWDFQYYFQSIRPVPICQLYHTFAFPSMEAMYTGAILGAFFTYAYYYTVYLSWFSWDIIYLCGCLVPFILIYTEYNRWWEVAFSMGFGFLSALAFVVIVKLFMKPRMRYLHLHFPLYIFGYSSELIKKNCHSQEILEALERVEVYRE